MIDLASGNSSGSSFELQKTVQKCSTSHDVASVDALNAEPSRSRLSFNKLDRLACVWRSAALH
jgi:hypothetical protein